MILIIFAHSMVLFGFVLDLVFLVSIGTKPDDNEIIAKHNKKKTLGLKLELQENKSFLVWALYRQHIHISIHGCKYMLKNT